MTSFYPARFVYNRYVYTLYIFLRSFVFKYSVPSLLDNKDDTFM